MTNEQILKRAIRKAKKNGWDIDLEDALNVVADDFDRYSNDLDFVIFPWIFNHDFAKASWGEEEIVEMNYYRYKMKFGEKLPKSKNQELLGTPMPAWQFHLREMVLEEDKLKYIEKFIN